MMERTFYIITSFLLVANAWFQHCNRNSIREIHTKFSRKLFAKNIDSDSVSKSDDLMDQIKNVEEDIAAVKNADPNWMKDSASKILITELTREITELTRQKIFLLQASAAKKKEQGKEDVEVPLRKSKKSTYQEENMLAVCNLLLDISKEQSVSIDITSPNSTDQLKNAIHVSNTEGKFLRVSIFNSLSINSSDSVGYYGYKAVCIEALILPKPLVWPMLTSGKQYKVSNKQILFRRLSIQDKDRDQSTIKLLGPSAEELIQIDQTQGQHVAWLGLPGIGKSLGTAVVLVELVRKLAQGHIEEILYKTPVDCFIISLATDHKIQLQSQRFILRDLPAYSDSQDGIVIMLELDEADTSVPSTNCPTMVTTPSSQADSLLKSLIKSRALEQYLVQPWLREEARLFFWAKEVLIGKNQSHWERVFNTVGGVMRHLDLHEKEIPKLLHASYGSASSDDTTGDKSFKQFFKALNELSMYNIPPAAELYVVPIVTPMAPTARIFGSFVNELNEETLNTRFDFLSTWTRDRISYSISDQTQYDTLKRYGLTPHTTNQSFLKSKT